MKIQTKTLYRIALQHLLDQLDQICSKLGKESQNYDNPDSNEIKLFLGNQLSVLVLEDLVNNELRRKEKYDYDARLKWTILMQPCIKLLGAPEKEPHTSAEHFFFWITQYRTVFTHDPKFWSDEDFWHEHFIKMTQLKMIGIPVEASDRLLHSISRACSAQLFFLTLSNFQFVTDEGLKCLEECQLLKTVKSSVDFSLNFISLEGISSLLSKCPCLESILGFDHMGKLLDHMARNEGSTLSPLKLISYIENEITNVSIKTLEVMCPNLIYITLKNDENLPNSILFDLAHSSLNLRSISLVDFIYDSAFKSFFKQKGQGISAVTISGSRAEINSEILTFIGKNCPQLVYLRLKLPPSKPVLQEFTPENADPSLFNKLRSLYLTGNDSFLNFTYNFIVSNSNGIKLIFLICEVGHTMGEEFIQLLRLNKLHSLESLWLPHNVKVPLNILKRLLHQLPKLSSYCSNSVTDVLLLMKEFKGIDFFICSSSNTFL